MAQTAERSVVPLPVETITAAGAGALMALVVVSPIIGLLRSNYHAYGLFRLDKSLAERSEQRIPEWRLLDAARNWGWIGAKLAQRRFRHKTRKEPFRTDLNWIGVILGVKLTVVTAAVIFVLTLPQTGDLAMDLKQMLNGSVGPVTVSAAEPGQVRPRPRP